jgi:hypothetical protein
VQLLQDLSINAGTHKALAIGVERREATLGTGAWDKDLILSHMTGRCMMFGVGDTPGMVRDPETDMRSVRLVPLSISRQGIGKRKLH